MFRRNRIWRLLLADILLCAIVINTPAFAEMLAAPPTPAAAPTVIADPAPPPSLLPPAQPTPPSGSLQPLVTSCLATNSCIVSGGRPPGNGPAPGEPFGALALGIFRYTKIDLTVNAPIPIVIARVYRDNDATNNVWNARDFGIGTSLNYSLYLYSAAEVNGQANPYSNINVVLPDGGQITCTCSNGQCGTYQAAQLTCAAQPSGELFDSVLKYNAATPGWDLTRKDGMVYSFGQGAPLQSIHDRNNNSITISRNGGQNGQITNIAASNGRSVNFTYNGPGYIRTIADNLLQTDPNYREIDYTYYNQGMLNTASNGTYVHHNTNPKTTYFYGAAIGNLTEINLTATDSDDTSHANFNYITRNSNGNIITFGPDLGLNGYAYAYSTCSTPTGTGIKVTITAPDNTNRIYCYDPKHYLYTDTRGPQQPQPEVTTYTRDSLERITVINENNLRNTTFEYNSNGDVTSIKQSPGPGTSPSITTTLAYQAPYQGIGSIVFDQLTRVTDPLNNLTQYGYDSYGNQNSFTDPLNRTTTYTYNSLGQLKSTTTPLNETTWFDYYSPSADLKTIKDPLQNVTTFTADTLGRVIQVSTPMGHTAQYAYDALDNITAATDGNGNTTSYTYDLLGLPLSVTDAKGNATTIKRPWTLNKETICDMQVPPKCAVADLNNAGNKTDYIDKLGIKTVLTYDAFQRPQLVKINTTNVPNYDSHQISLSYDGLDRPLSIGDNITVQINSLSNTIQYQYDGADNVVSETAQASSQLNPTLITYQYDGDSRRTQMAISGTGSGQSYSYGYNADSELTGITGGALSAALTYDPDGHRQTLTTGAVVTTYGYDADSQLTSLSFNNSLGQIGYNYDIDGRVTSESGSLASLNLPQTEGPNLYSPINQITNWNSGATTSDFAGNLTSDSTGLSYTWDSRNQLASISGPPVSSFTAAYDTIMRRFDQTTAFGGTTTYLHDQNNVAQSTTTGGPSNPLNNFLTVPGTGEVLAFTTTGGTYVPIHDRLGSTIGLVNSSNALQTQYTYEPFGKVTISGSASSYPFLFAGMELDSSGFYHTQTRYYSPAFGRFLSADGGLPANAFTYAGNDPVNAIDPSGKSSEYVSGFNGISPGAENPIWTTSSDTKQGDGLAGALMAQSCVGGDCPYQTGTPASSQGGLLGIIIGFFVDLFGGGGHTTIYLPGQYRFPHNPAIFKITDSQQQHQEFAPAVSQNSSIFEGRIVLAAAEDDEEDVPGTEEEGGGLEPPSPGPTVEVEPYLPYPIEGRPPRNGLERDAMHEAMKGGGRQIMEGKEWDDPRFQEPGWQKWQYVLRTDEGNITVHYMLNVTTREMTQFKFTYPP